MIAYWLAFAIVLAVLLGIAGALYADIMRELDRFQDWGDLDELEALDARPKED